MDMEYVVLPTELDFKIGGTQVVGFLYDDRFNTIYLFGERAKLLAREKLYGYYKTFPLDFSGKKLKHRFGDK